MKIKKGLSRKMRARDCPRGIVADWFDDGLRIIVLALRSSHFTAYIGLPIKHSLSGFDYNEVSLIDVHGGFTFAGEGGENFPAGYYWYGWDYAHCGDYAFSKGDKPLEGEKDWTLGEVIEDAGDTIYYFQKLRKLAEMIRDK